LLVAVVAQGQFLQMVVQRHPQVADVVPRHDVGDVALEILEHGPQHVRGQQNDGQHADPFPRAGPAELVGDDADHFPENPRARQAEDRDGQCRNDDDDHMDLVRRQKCAKTGENGHESSPTLLYPKPAGGSSAPAPGSRPTNVPEESVRGGANCNNRRRAGRHSETLKALGSGNPGPGAHSADAWGVAACKRKSPSWPESSPSSCWVCWFCSSSTSRGRSSAWPTAFRPPSGPWSSGCFWRCTRRPWGRWCTSTPGCPSRCGRPRAKTTRSIPGTWSG